MANLGTFKIACNGEYKDLATESGLTFTSGNVYYIQFYNKGFFRQGDLGKGYVISSDRSLGFEHDGSTIYIGGAGTIEVNVSE